MLMQVEPLYWEHTRKNASEIIRQTQPTMTTTSAINSVKFIYINFNNQNKLDSENEQN